MTPIRRTRPALVATAVLVGAVASCKLEPETPELRHEINTKFFEENEDYANDAAAQARMAGALDMLFGSPNDPQYLLTEDMLDEEFNPNWGDVELTEAQYDAMLADNEERYAKQLTAIDEGRWDDVLLPREALDLVDLFEQDMEALDELRSRVGVEPEEGDEAVTEADVEALDTELREIWRESLVNYYPSLRDSAEMFRTQCMHCHGVSGGGDGTTAPFLNPLPRDYRPGIFKFTALANKARPRREDLFRILEEGIYTTAMPSFRRFSDAQLHGLVDYVRLLSIRGRVEELAFLDYDPDEGGIKLESVVEAYDDEWAAWSDSYDHVVAYEGDVPPATPESIARGRELYLDEQGANCVKCHGTYGRGDGAGAWEPDPDNPGELRRIRDDWGNEIVPRDLTRGVFRFGRRPIDIYRRVRNGINGTPMPDQTTLVDADGNRLLSDDDLWDITHYVRSLSTREKPHYGEGHGDDGHGEDGHDHGEDH